MIPHDGPACPTPLEEEEEPPWHGASAGIVSSSIVKKTPRTRNLGLKNQINLRYLLEYLDINSKLNHSLGLYFPNTGHFGFILKGYTRGTART